MTTQGSGGLRYGRSSARRPRLQISTTSVDATWFAANQLRTTRIRHATPAELEINARELRRSMSPGIGRRWFTLVRQVVPGLRFRIFATNVADALTDEVHEAVAAQAYDATLAERSGGENLVTLERDLRADLSNANWTRH